MDLGAGVGIISVLLAKTLAGSRVLAVEIQHRLAGCARRNVVDNSLEGKMVVLEMNWEELNSQNPGEPVHYAVCNPPYRQLGTGRTNPHEEQAQARHEILGSLSSAAQAASRVLSLGGTLALIYPAARLVDLNLDLTIAGFEPKRMRLIHSRATAKATLVMVEAVLGGGRELLVEPPLYLYGSGREYTPEARAILSGADVGQPIAEPDFPAAPRL